MAVRLEKEGAVGVIVLDRPPANSYDYSFLREFGSAVDEARWDGALGAVVVASASEKFFSAGADVSAFRAGSQRQRAVTALLGHEGFRKMENTPMVFVAAIAGHAKVVASLGFGAPLDVGLALEREAIARVFASDDAAEGIQAFADKRPARFKGS